MNLKINNTMPFKANLRIHGKQLASETNKIYQNAIELLERNRKIATQSQEYMQSPHIQKAVKFLPCDTFVRLNTGILDREGTKADDILGFIPFLSFETKSINEQINLARHLEHAKDTLVLSLDEAGNLKTKEIDSWFDNLLSFYQKQK